MKKQIATLTMKVKDKKFVAEVVTPDAKKPVVISSRVDASLLRFCVNNGIIKAQKAFADKYELKIVDEIGRSNRGRKPHGYEPKEVKSAIIKAETVTSYKSFAKTVKASGSRDETMKNAGYKLVTTLTVESGMTPKDAVSAVTGAKSLVYIPASKDGKTLKVYGK